MQLRMESRRHRVSSSLISLNLLLLFSTLSWTNAARPANDDFATSIPILAVTNLPASNSAEHIVNFSAATSEASEPVLDFSTNTVWFQFSPPVPGLLQLDCKPGIGGAAYTGSSFDNLSPVSFCCHHRDDFQSVQTSPGTKYLIQLAYRGTNQVKIVATFYPHIFLVSPPRTATFAVEPLPAADGTYSPDAVVRIKAIANPGYQLVSMLYSNSAGLVISTNLEYHGPVPRNSFLIRTRSSSDSFQDPRPLDGLRPYDMEYFDNASSEPDEPKSGANAPYPSLWWSWIAPEDGLVDMTSGPDDRRSVAMTAFKGETLPKLVPVMALGQTTFPARAGEKFYIRGDFITSYASTNSDWFSYPSTHAAWLSIRQPATPVPLKSSFALAPASLGVRFRYVPFSISAESATEARLALDGVHSIKDQFARKLELNPDFLSSNHVGLYGAVEFEGFLFVAPGTNSFLITADDVQFELLLGANYSPINLNTILREQVEARFTITSPGALYPFRLLVWVGPRVPGLPAPKLAWNWINPASGQAVPIDSVPEMAIGYQTIPPVPTVWCESLHPRVSETDQAGGIFQVHRAEEPSSAPLIVQFEVLGTASNGVDYAEIPAHYEIPPDAASGSVPLRPLADNLEEGSEAANLVLETDGSYLLGNQISASIEIDDANPDSSLPRVRILDLPQSGLLNPASLHFNVEASDSSGIALVELYYRRAGSATSNFVGRSTSGPFQISRPGMPAGEFQFFAVATDNQGTRRVSDPVNVVINLAKTHLENPGLLHWFRAEDNARDEVTQRFANARYGAAYLLGPSGSAFNTEHGFFDFPETHDFSSGATIQARVQNIRKSGVAIALKGPRSEILLQEGGRSFSLVAGFQSASLVQASWGAQDAVQITATYDGYEMRLYHDLALIGTRPFFPQIPLSITNFVIGSRTAGTQPTGLRSFFSDDLFEGWVDEVKIYDRALSHSQIASEYYQVRFPENRIVSAGDTVVLKAEAEPLENVRFYWTFPGYFGSPPFVRTNDAIVLTNIGEREAGLYQVTIHNGQEWFPSPVVAVSIVSLTLDRQGHRKLSIAGPANATYDIQFTDNLVPPINWKGLGRVTTLSRGSFQSYFDRTSVSSGFYRVRAINQP